MHAYAKRAYQLNAACLNESISGTSIRASGRNLRIGTNGVDGDTSRQRLANGGQAEKHAPVVALYLIEN
jgi:hypothetical protein